MLCVCVSPLSFEKKLQIFTKFNTNIMPLEATQILYILTSYSP